MTVEQAILKPTARIIILAEITCGIHFRAWVVDGVLTNTYKVSTEREIESVKWNLTTTLAEETSAAAVDGNDGSWFWDGTTLWVRPPTGENIFENTVQAFAAFYFAQHPKIFNDRPYEPRLLTAPNLSQRIEFVFGDVAQIGGGNIELQNADGFFDAMQDYQWDAGQVTLRLGVDTPGVGGVIEEMAIGDYVTLATWVPDDWTRDNESFNLKVVEPKARLKSKLPFEFYTRTDYPNIDDDNIGSAIPIAYGKLFGIKPTVIDPGAKQFKVAGHAVREFTAVRVEQTRDEFKTRTPATTDWYLYSANVWRYYLADETVTAVKEGGATLEELSSIDDVLTTPGSWATQENYVYVRPTTGTIASAAYAVESAKQVTGWRPINFASVDAANGEFTLGDDWGVGQAVAVDFQGKTDSGTIINNPVDIIEDLLTTAGITNLDSASFTAARAKLDIGFDEDGGRVVIRQVGVYIDEATDVLEVIGKILAAIHGFMFSDASGQFHIGIFSPQPGESLTRFSDTDILDFEEITENSENISKVMASYQPRVEQDFAQHEDTERVANQYVHAQTVPVVREVETLLTEEKDVERYNQRTLRYEGQPIKEFRIKTKWQGLLHQPGDQIWLQYSRRGVDQVLEIIETKLNLGSKEVEFVLGNLRGIHAESGFWVAAADTLPARFANLAGYGSGSLVWNDGWHDDIKAWVRQNVGHWTDENGFADPTDAESFRTSTWV